MYFFHVIFYAFSINFTTNSAAFQADATWLGGSMSLSQQKEMLLTREAQGPIRFLICAGFFFCKVSLWMWHVLFFLQAWCLPNGRRKRAIAFPSALPPRAIFSDEALHRGNSLSSLQDKDCSHYPILFWPCNGMKKGLFSSSFFACPGCWPSTYFCLKLFSLKLKYSWSSI